MEDYSEKVLASVFTAAQLKRREIILRIISRVEPSEIFYRDNVPELGEGFPRNIVYAICTGWIGGHTKKFGMTLPISRIMYDDPEYRGLIESRVKSEFKSILFSRLFYNETLAKPKGKLPA